MALTRIEQPNDWSAVYSQIIYKFQSDFGEDFRIGSVLTTNTFADTSGYLQVEFTTAHNLAAGDYFWISDTGGATPVAVRVISVVNTTTVVLDISFDLTFVEGWKMAYKYNASVQIWAIDDETVYEAIGVLTSPPVWNGTNYIFTFDVAPVLKNYITGNTPELNTPTNGEATAATIQFYIEYREEYILGVNDLPDYYEFSFQPDSEGGYYVINYKIANNATEQYTEQPDSAYKQEAYVFDGVNADRKFLTNQPVIPYCYDHDLFFYLNSEEISTPNLKVRQYNGAGTLTDTQTIAIADLPFGQNIIYFDPATVVLLDATQKMCFAVEDGGIETESLCYTITRNCCSNQEYRVVWFNNKGGYSQYVLTGQSTTGIDVERSDAFKTNLFPSRFKPPFRQYSNVSNVPRESIILRHETKDRDVHEWLIYDLLTSPDVYLVETIDSLDRLLPLIVDTDSVTMRKDGDQRYQLSIPFMKAYDKIVQSR